MDMNTYQRRAATTAQYPMLMRVIYPAMGLAGEAGEVCNKLKKVYRDDEGIVTPERLQQIKKELGGVLWYTAQLATDLGISLADVAESNLAELLSRAERNVIKGDGDNR